MSLEQYALVLCAKDEGAPLDVALELASVTPRDWPAGEAQHTARISRAPEDPAILPAFDEAMRAARAALARPVTPIDEDAALWGRWLRAWSTAQDPLGMLARAGMDIADVVRLSTSWGERLREDRALAEQFAAEMQGNSPAPEVRVAESPRLVAARAAVSARREPPREPAADTPARPSLSAPLPWEVTPAPAEPRVIPSFMAARPPEMAPLSGGAAVPPAMVGSPSAPVPVFPPRSPSIATAPSTGAMPVVPGAALPLPFDANARPDEMPSQGPQQQSGMTNDVDVSAIVRKVLAFSSPGGKTPLSAGTSFAAAPERPALPFASKGSPGDAAERAKQHAAEAQGSSPVGPSTPIGETTGVDVAAIARQVLAFGSQKKQEPPPAPATPPIVPTLTAEQYASLCVDLEMHPAQAAEILRRYGTNEPGKRVLDEGWSRVFAEQPPRRAAFEKAKAAYRTWLSQGGRR